MTRPSLSQVDKIEQHKRTLKAWAAAGYINEVARTELDKHETTFRRHLRAAIKWGKTKEGKAWLQTFKIDITGTTRMLMGAPDIQIKELQHQIGVLRKALADKDKETLSVRAIREHIFGMAQYKPTLPEWVNHRDVVKYDHGIPTLILSDLHFGEVVRKEQVFGTNEYNMEIATRRIRHTVDRTITLLQDDVLANPNFPGIVLVLGGDSVSGIIHPEFEMTNEKPIMSQALECADVLHGVILKLFRTFGKVYVVGVPGNHGRSTMKPMAKNNAELSYDWQICQMLERMLMTQVARGDIIFDCPAARDITFRIAGRPFRLTHGDQFRGGDGIIGPLGPITRGDKKKRATAMTLPTNAEWYETLLLGHFHTLHQDARRIINGSTKGYDEYCMANNFEWEPPQQALFLTHPAYGINHMMPVLCEEPVKVAKIPAWVEFQARADLGSPLARFTDTLDWIEKGGS